MSAIGVWGRRFAVALAVTAGLGGATGLGGSSTAEAAPTVWAKVRTPDLQRQSDLAARVDHLMDMYRRPELSDHPSEDMGPEFLREAHKLLEEGGAAQSQDLEMRFRLAQVLENLGEVAKASAILEWIVRANPPAPLLADVWERLAICYARMGRHDEEIKAYAEALARQPHSSARSLLLANRAEAYMALGRLSEAIEGYQQALTTVSGTPIQIIYHGVTTLWGLGVALDRNGDLEGALQAITLARTYDPQDIRIRSSDWFFVPDYDSAWYAALGYWMKARQGDLELEGRREAYNNAVTSWAEYIARAPATDAWISIAKARLHACEQERDVAMRRATHKSAGGQSKVEPVEDDALTTMARKSKRRQKEKERVAPQD